MRRLITIAALLSCAGCATVSEPMPKQANVPAAWRAAQAPTGESIAPWWEALGDPALNALVAEALEENPDIQRAAARVAQARSLVAAARAEQRPSLAADAGTVSQRYPAQRYPGFPDTVPASTLNAVSFGIQAAYEIDLFGRLAKGVTRAGDEQQATQWDLRGAQLAVAREMVAAYADARAAQARLRTARSMVAVSGSLRAADSRLIRAGLGTRREARESDDVAGAAVAKTAALEREEAIALARIGVLLGKAPVEVAPPPDHGASLAIPLQVAPDLPATVIARRPDVQAAWYRLAAATTDIARVRLERYPRISLTGALGFASNQLRTLLAQDALAWVLGAAASMPLADGGRVEARTAQAIAVRDEYTIAYRLTVIVALGEVEEALASWQSANTLVEHLDQALARRLQDRQETARALELGSADARERLRGEMAALQGQEALTAAQCARIAAYAAVQHALAR
jgi:NodT family efflux transporter outer membrane factor (OMF) lipoprotein